MELKGLAFKSWLHNGSLGLFQSKLSHSATQAKGEEFSGALISNSDLYFVSPDVQYQHHGTINFFKGCRLVSAQPHFSWQHNYKFGLADGSSSFWTKPCAPLKGWALFRVKQNANCSDLHLTPSQDCAISGGETAKGNFLYCTVRKQIPYIFQMALPKNCQSF